jgi:thioesterase DpgC
LAAHVDGVEAGLARLPRRPDRDEADRRAAGALLADARAARQSFLACHVEGVYDQLTDGRTRQVRLGDLVLAAAERFPGLVPDRAAMERERTLIQSERDGHEIDQGIFCAAVLRSPSAGAHLIDAMLRPTMGAVVLREQFRQTGRLRLPSLELERRDGAAHLTFHNGRTLNAENNQLVADLETAVDLALLDDQVHVGVLRGGPVDHPRYPGRRVFSAGINLKDLRNGRIAFVEFLMQRELGPINKIVRGLDRRVQKPWIGAVDAFAIGGGMQLLLVLDRVIAEEGASFSLPAADEGIVPGLGNLRLGRAAGSRLTRRIILGGERLEAGSPEGRVVCDEVVAPGEMATAIDRAVAALSGPAVVANRQMLTLAEEPLDLYREYLATFAEVQSVRAYSDDVLAKLERRWQRPVPGGA